MGYAPRMEPEPTPEPEERDASPERLQEEEAMRFPEYSDPEERRARVGLGDQEPEPRGAPLPSEPERGQPSRLGGED